METMASVGVAAGFVAGMLGVGSSILFVPGLVLFLDLSSSTARRPRWPR